MFFIVLLVYSYVLFQDGENADAKKYIEVADTIDDVPFGVIYDAGVAAKSTLAVGEIAVFKQVLQVAVFKTLFSFNLV